MAPAQPAAIWQRLLRLWWLNALVVLPLHAFRGILEGDSEVDLYINGIYTRKDTTQPVLPLNGLRKFDASQTVAFPMYQSDPFKPGDVIALHVKTSQPTVVAVTLPDMRFKLYPGWGAVIAAFEDGLITNEQWRCTIEKEDKWMWKNTVDWHWPFAVAQETSCCPWRDKKHKWKKLSAKWIGPKNASVAREFFCRYKLPASQTIMDASLQYANQVKMPQLNVTDLIIAKTVASVAFSIGQPAQISCMLLNAKYQLRPPSPFEVESTGETMKITGWSDVTVGNYRHHYSDAALAWHTLANVEACQAKCQEFKGANGPCGAITFFTKGSDPTTKENCKLMKEINDANLILTASFNTERVVHMVLRPFPVQDTIGVPALLFPGSVYSAFCSARDFTTNYHSTWEAVKTTEFSQRTPGCFDCGAKTLPRIEIMGGWASNDALTAIVWSSQPGRVFCGTKALATPTEEFSLTPAQIKETSIDVSKHFSLIAKAGVSSQVTVGGLAPHILYEFACMAESEAGGESDLENLKETRRRWWTEATFFRNEDPRPDTVTVVPIWSLAITWKVLPATFGDPTASLTVSVRMTEIGYLWCQRYLTSETETDGIPDGARLRQEGYRIKVQDATKDAGGTFKDVLHNMTYQAFCTGEWNDFRNETSISTDGLPPDYPEATVVQSSRSLDEVRLRIQIQRGPAVTYCFPYKWPRRPFSSRPPLPDPLSMRESPFKTESMTEMVAYFDMVLSNLASGSLYDIYCYAEEWLPPFPPGAYEPLRKGMSLEAIRSTRMTIQTEGPQYRELGWTCTAGHACGISNLVGEGLTVADKIIVQSQQCPGRCLCNGMEDEDNKGATCSAVSHDRGIRAPDPMYNGIEAVDKADPLGPWCYVTRGTCRDEAESQTFSSLYISYAACIFQNSTVGVPGAEPPGFPDMGMATVTSNEADAYRFGTQALLAGGKPYHLCWCNGTSSLCNAVSDFRMRVGILHLSGPSVAQISKTMHCLAGRPCTLRFYDGHGLANGNRLVVMPNSQLGCKWSRQSPGDPTSVAGIPNNAVSQEATDLGTTYSWGSETVQAPGGVYLLCWCGSTWGAHHWLRPDCPVPRPEKGDHYFAYGGFLSVVGPSFGPLRLCNVGMECILDNIPGNLLEGGDKVSILKNCGSNTPAPDDWGWGTSTSLPDDWLPGGWLAFGPVVSSSVLESSGGPLRSADQVSRGVWGMPNHGMSLPNPRAGYFSWGAASQNAPGDYALCWCAAKAECTQPEHYKVLVSAIRFLGPHVLPSASQARICVRNRQCEILNFTGTWPSSGGQLFIASGHCGSVAALGAPRDGISFTSTNGDSFKWGGDPLATPPGKYRLCWCFQGFACAQPEDFQSFAGILRVKSPFGPLREFWCGIGVPCRLENVLGEGSNSGDNVMIMSVCGDGLGSPAFEDRGRSTETGPDGTWFQLPTAIAAGKFRACWCAGEALCEFGRDFDHDLGPVRVGGPDSSAVYQCYEWEPCSVTGLLGTELYDGDRIIAIHPSMNCSEDNITYETNPKIDSLPGWPQGGMTDYGIRRGTVFTWGGGQVRVPPGVYSLCWCSVGRAPGGICNASAPFDMSAGQMKVGTSKEFMFATRVKDPEPRSMEGLYALLLLAPLGLVACGLGFLGWKRVTPSTNKFFREAPPPFPKKKAWASGEQERLKLEHAVSQVSAQRELAVGTMAMEDGRMLEIDMPDFTGRKEISVEIIAAEAMRRSMETRLKAIEDEARAPIRKSRSVEPSPEDPASMPSSLPKKGKKGLAEKFRQFTSRLSRKSRHTNVAELDLRGVREISRRPSIPGQDAEEEVGHVGPASPCAAWKQEWDQAEDGPMPPSMEFTFNNDNSAFNERRKQVILDILDDKRRKQDDSFFIEGVKVSDM